jgi:hypothetical protein
VALHIGTLIAAAWYFRREWVALAIGRLHRQAAVQTTGVARGLSHRRNDPGGDWG